MRTRLAALLAVAALATTGLTAAPAAPAPEAKRSKPVGTVLRAQPLRQDLWIPGTERAFKLRYVTTDAFGDRVPSTGTVFVPKGRAPQGGWPVISWAHGTSGIGDACAPSKVGPAMPERDFAYLSTWMKQGYAVVASDYAGLGTRGVHAYLHNESTAHNVVDMVKAARAFAKAELPRRSRLSRKWVTIGQSQGGGGAIATSSYATEFGGRKLDFRGGVGTGTPAYIELLVSLPGPGVLPVDASPALTAYLLYILVGMREVHPELDIDSALTAQGLEFVQLAESACVIELEEAVKGTPMGDFFSRPLATLPGYVDTARAYLGMPETSFEKPVFLANGLVDTDVPMETTAAYVALLRANGADVTFKTYPTDHNSTMAASLPDSVPFVEKLFRD
jgi:dienelactone hydrolase